MLSKARAVEQVTRDFEVEPDVVVRTELESRRLRSGVGERRCRTFSTYHSTQDARSPSVHFPPIGKDLLAFAKPTSARIGELNPTAVGFRHG